MLKNIVAAAALTLMASSSFAGTPGTVYGGLDVGSTKIDGFESETSFGGFVGYNFHQNFALEAGYRDLGAFKQAVDGDLDVDQAAISVVGSLPVGNGFNLFGRVGYNRVSYEDNSGKGHDNKALFGAGVGYAFSNKVSGRVEVQRPMRDVTNVSVSVAYQF
jgi:predicted porin